MLADATRFRRTAAGLCLVGTPLLLLLGDLLGTRGPTDPGAYLDALATRPAANEAAAVLAVAGFGLMVPALGGLLHLLRDRAVALGHAGGALALLGTVGFAFVAGTEYVHLAAAAPAADRAQMLALNDRVGAGVGYTLLNATELLGWFGGLLLLGLALLRARAVPPAAALALVAFPPLRLLGAAALPAVVLADLLLLAGLGAAGVAVLRQPDREWERPPRRAGR